MFSVERHEVLSVALKLERYGLIALSGGNVSARMDTGEILITPSGMFYDEMVDDDVLVLDPQGGVIEGSRKPSVDTPALLYIFSRLPEVNAVIHTHQPAATGLGLVLDELPCNLSTMANATEGPVAVAEYGDPGSLSMGVRAVDAIGQRLAVVLRHHGVIAVGRDLRQALYACVYLEEAAQSIAIALSTGRQMAIMSKKQIDEAVAVFHRYGQAPRQRSSKTAVADGAHKRPVENSHKREAGRGC